MKDIQWNIAAKVGSNVPVAHSKQKVLLTKTHNVQQNEFRKGENALVRNMK